MKPNKLYASLTKIKVLIFFCVMNRSHEFSFKNSHFVGDKLFKILHQQSICRVERFVQYCQSTYITSYTWYNCWITFFKIIQFFRVDIVKEIVYFLYSELLSWLHKFLKSCELHPQVCQNVTIFGLKGQSHELFMHVFI